MCVFTAIMFAGCLLLAGPLLKAFTSNAGYNSVILVVFFVGIIINFRQVLRLYPEIQWIEAYQTNTLGLKTAHPKLLS